MLEEMYSSPDGGKEMPKSMEGHEEHLKRMKMYMRAIVILSCQLDNNWNEL